MWLILCRNPAVSLGEHKAKNNICFSFAFCVLWLLQVFNRCPMHDPRIAVASCIEHERLAFELLEVRTRVQYLTRLRALSSEERAELDRRERAALTGAAPGSASVSASALTIGSAAATSLATMFTSLIGRF